MAEQAKKGGKPAAAPDKGAVSDADLEKVSGGAAGDPHTQDNWSIDTGTPFERGRASGGPRPA